MTTSISAPALPQEYVALTARLDDAAARYRLAQILEGLARFALLTGCVALIAIFLAGRLSLPAWLNLLLLASVIGAAIGGYVRFLHRPIFHRATYAEVARILEENGAGLDNALINAVLLAQELDAPAPRNAWVPHLLREAGAAAADAPLEKSVPWRGARRAWLFAGGALVVASLWAGFARQTFAHGMAVLMSPRQFVPAQGTVKIVEVLPGNETTVAGQTIDFSVRVEQIQKDIRPPDAQLAITYAGGERMTEYRMLATGTGDRFTYNGIVAAMNMTYVITVAGTQSERYAISVLPQIHVTGYSAEATPPAYTGREKVTLHLGEKELGAGKGDVDVPLGSDVTLSMALDAPAHEVLLDIAGDSPLTLTPDGIGRAFSAHFRALKPLPFVVRVNDGAAHTLLQMPAGDGQSWTIRPVPDAPPTIAASVPGRDIDAKPGDKVNLEAQAADDYGLSQVRLEIAKNDEKDFRAVQKWPLAEKDGKPAHAATIRTTLDLPASEYKLGDTLRYRFVATDNRELQDIDPALGGGGPQSTAGQIFTISFNDTAAAAAKSTKLWEELRAKLTAILEKQVALRQQADALAAGIDAARMQAIATPIQTGQKGIHDDIDALAKDFPFEPSMKLVQKSLQVLAVEDASAAIERGADILLLADSKGLPPLAVKLRQNQNRIIDVLQTLLAIAAADQAQIASTADHEGADMPASARDAWKKLAEELKNFQKEQAGVIDATADLAKKPKGEFDANDKKKLDDLAAMEDKWEKFLNDRLADMSKLDEQDPANASLLDELVQMKVELTAAKDALNAKATEIATPLEENGLENAKELTTHIERWLAAQPDRTAWQMEEPVTQNDQHMAELPKQLQDMVGDLMDKEEDLTQQMESTASKSMDSMDKGAGWDAMDGPISNMTAQGVTGNQLPKDMEIQGRSGEGREGQASGEMVGATAEGKEGRRTPTRLTPDAFSNSQVDDKSKLPEGGATGGGKKGGLGGEGLEGPAPADDPDITQRLAGQQAAIRNEGERLALQMHATGFDNFKLVEADAYLKKSEDALKANQYHTALYYQDQAVQSMNTAKVLAAGEVHVVTDTSPTADEKKQKEMDSALNGPMPKGYADPVKAYFEKMAGGQQ